MTTTIISKGEESAKNIGALLRARNPLLWIITREEARAERYIIAAAASANYNVLTWDVAQGVCGIDGKPMNNVGSPDPGETLATIRERAQNTYIDPDRPDRNVWVMRDLHRWLEGPPGAAPTRQLRNLARLLPSVGKQTAQAIIIISPSANIPEDLAGHATVIEWPLPDRMEIAEILEEAIEVMPDDIKDSCAPNGTRDAAIDAAVGLTGEEAQACYSRSLVQLRRIDPATVAKEKKQIITRERVLEWYDPIPGGLDSVGGLDLLKAWLMQRRSAYSAEARAYGLPAPKGTLLVGVQGCGKSLTSKAIATAWGVPLLRVDLGALKSKFVGESEGNLRKAFKVIEAIGRCVVWFDEIEKALQGATSGSADGGVSSDALGAILSWMQERQGEAFVIATANNVESLPPELLRKGRFDEVFFVDLPTQEERTSILDVTLRQHGRDPGNLISVAQSAKIAKACEGFTGSEVAAIVPDALFEAFNDGKREPTESDLMNAASKVVPLSKTYAEKIDALRQWAQTRARPATSREETSKRSAPKSAARQLDI